MSYTKTTWTNNSGSKINATNLNKIEQGIYDNDAKITKLQNKHIYSTTEQAVGTWTDGKTIYRKVINGTWTSGGTSRSVATGLTDWTMLPMTDALLSNVSKAGFDGTYGFRFERSGNNIVFNFGTAESWVGVYTIVLYYTKNS